MPRQLIVNNIPYAYPTSGDEPGWGNEATAWSSGVTDVLNDLLGPNDILETAFNIANNQTTFVDVTGLAFNSAQVRAADINYSIFRISNTNPSGNTETGTIKIDYDNAVGWSIGQGGVLDNAGVIFDITPTGQLQYKSTDIGSVNYSGLMKFRAKTLSQ